MTQAANQQQQPQPNISQLTAREYQVAVLVALALTDRQIADSLFISVTTVKAHINTVRSKLGLANRTAVCRWMLVTHYEGNTNLLDNVL